MLWRWGFERCVGSWREGNLAQGFYIWKAHVATQLILRAAEEGVVASQEGQRQALQGSAAGICAWCRGVKQEALRRWHSQVQARRLGATLEEAEASKVQLQQELAKMEQRCAAAEQGRTAMEQERLVVRGELDAERVEHAVTRRRAELLEKELPKPALELLEAERRLQESQLMVEAMEGQVQGMEYQCKTAMGQLATDSFIRYLHVYVRAQLGCFLSAWREHVVAVVALREMQRNKALLESRIGEAFEQGDFLRRGFERWVARTANERLRWSVVMHATAATKQRSRVRGMQALSCWREWSQGASLSGRWSTSLRTRLAFPNS